LLWFLLVVRQKKAKAKQQSGSDRRTPSLKNSKAAATAALQSKSGLARWPPYQTSAV